MASSSDVGPAEDVVQTLLEHLVDPMLPLKSSARETPSLSQQQSVAKQVHAIVLLYNYYHRKQHHEVEFLNFESFCKLAVTLRPPLMAYMKLMHQTDYTKLDDPENELSLTEKAIMDACNMSLVLDASKDVPSTEGWPISKVAVLVVDPRKENCCLLFSSITHGVWSVIEKDLEVSKACSEGAVEGKHTNKRKRMTRKPLRVVTNADEAGFQKLAYSVVKDTIGINQTDLMVLESHLVYSTSKEKTAACFYILQCSEIINMDLQVPVKDAIMSLRGPVVKKISGSWTVTPVVEYFHVLPYAGILSDWLSRGMLSTDVQDLKVGLDNINVISSQKTENCSPCSKEVIEDKDNSNSVGNERNGDNTESPKLKDYNGRLSNCQSYSFGGSHVMDVGGSHVMDVDDSSMVSSQNEDINKKNCTAIKVYHHQKKTTQLENATNATSGIKVEVDMGDPTMKVCINDGKNEKIGNGNKVHNVIPSDQDGMPIGDHERAPFQLHSKYLEKLHLILASKENALSQTALKVLLRKRDKLSQHLRNLEDEIAQCDKNIQTILDGGEDNLAVKIDAVIDGCNDVCQKSEILAQDRTYRHFSEDQGLPQYMNKKKLSEAILTLRNPCQELDDICHENNWSLPTYHVALSNGGFEANVTVKGIDFDCSGGSNLCSNPREARESAATEMITKLIDMAGQSQTQTQTQTQTL